MRTLNKDDFLENYQIYFGENLSEVLSMSPQYEKNDTMFVNMVADKIDELIKNYNYSYDYEDASVYQQNAVKKAELYQAFYEAHGVDFDNISGYDGSTLISRDEIAGHRYSSRVLEILKNNDLLHKPIRGVPDNG